MSGFPQPHGRSCGRMASCGAAVFDDTNDGNSTTTTTTARLLWIGGRYLDIVPGITSADVEYEGLLFGLQQCAAFVSGRRRNLPEGHNDDDDDNDVGSSSSSPPTATTLVVRGDCKAILDQLDGNAVPRKLRPKHERAIKLIQEEGMDDIISFQHVLRQENTLCDSICANIMQIVERRQVSTFQSELQQLTAAAVLLEDDERTTSSGAQVLRQHEIRHRRDHLTNLIEQFVSGRRSLIRHSLRPALYEQATAVANRLDDGMALTHIGQQLVKESKFWRPSAADDVVPTRQYMMTRGISLQVRGLQLLGNDKQARRLLQKHRYALDRISTTSHDLLSDVLDNRFLDNDPCFTTGNNNHRGETESLQQTWYDEASKQDIEVLKQGYWLDNTQ